MKFLLRILVGLCLSALVSAGASLQFVSLRDAALPVPAGGSGDSGSAVVSADGRYVLFASMAGNLVVISNPATVSALAPPRQNVFLRDRTTQITTLLSINPAGNAGGDGDSFPVAISTNGQFALYESSAGNLGPTDTNGASDVFLRDLLVGTNFLVSVRTNGGSGNGASRSATMTPDGRYIAFVSAANNLAAGDTNGIPDVFVRDRLAGTTTLVSLGAKSTGSFFLPGVSSEAPEITPDGRFVAFYSSATNLVPGVTNSGEVYVRDLVAGTTTLASTNARTLLQSVVGTTNGISCNHRISDDGRYVAFVTATNPIAGAYSRGVVLRHDLQSGVTEIVHTNANVPPLPPGELRSLDLTPDGRFVAFVGNTNVGGSPAQCVYRWDGQSATTELVSRKLNGGVTAGAACDWPTLDASGRYVAFVCSDINLTTNTLVGSPQLYIRDLTLAQTEAVHRSGAGAAYAVNTLTAPAMSANGQVIVFDAPDSKVLTNDNNNASDVFARDRQAGATEMISVHHATLPALTANSLSGSSTLSVSSNGRFVAFASDGDGVVAGDTNGFRDVFVRDLFLATNILVSTASNGSPANGNSTGPAISADGRYVAFASYATNLVTGDANNYADVFVRDLHTGARTAISVTPAGLLTANGDSAYAPFISADGRYVTFASAAVNLVSPSTTGVNVFQRDRQTGVTRALTTGGGSYFSPTPDGNRVVFVGLITGVATARIYVWDSATAARIYTNTATSPLAVSISPNGQRLAYVADSGSTLYTADLVAKTNGQVSTGTFPGRVGLKFSADGRYLAYCTTAAKTNDSNGVSDVWLYDFAAGTNIQVCRQYYGAQTPNGTSDAPDISPDGRFVAYRSFATNAVTNDFNAVADLLLFDRVSGVTLPLTRTEAGSRTANKSSWGPMFSGDGQTLVFATWASDLLAGDFNGGSDVVQLAVPTTAVVDSDGDEMDDTWETIYFGGLGHNGNADSDADGSSDRFEFENFSNPTNGNSAFRAELTVGPPRSLTWSAMAWRSYQVQYKNDLGDANWLHLPTSISLAGTNGVATDALPIGDRRFYRVRLNP